jgi:alpha-L-fucosidase
MRRFFLIALLLAAAATAQTYHPTDSNLQARTWFQDAKFGMFIHWGVYSVMGKGEWVMNNDKIPVSEYEKLAPQCNPTGFDAAEWVALAKAAGMKYITITSKHHDGFAMFATKQNKWNIVDATPYAKDPLKMLADECHKQGIKLFFYHSQLDWPVPITFRAGAPGGTAGHPSGDFSRYLDFMDSQLRATHELWRIGGIWFDGWWDRPDADWRLPKPMDSFTACTALIGSNHHRAFDGEDFQMFEKDLPGGNTAGLVSRKWLAAARITTPLTSPGATIQPTELQSSEQLIQFLARNAGYGARFLLNIGPMPTGKSA